VKFGNKVGQNKGHICCFGDTAGQKNTFCSKADRCRNVFAALDARSAKNAHIGVSGFYDRNRIAYN